MKKSWIIGVVILLVLIVGGVFVISKQILFKGCTEEAKICEDGSAVGRTDWNCEFSDCPELQSCGLEDTCPKERKCLDFPDDSKGAYCYEGDPCLKCSSKECEVLESYPASIVCSWPIHG